MSHARVDRNLQGGVASGSTRRRLLLSMMCAAAGLKAGAATAQELSYPVRPVRLLVGQSAGSGSDILARLIAQWLSQRLGQPFVIENRPGAGGDISVEAVLRAKPDGYALLVITSTNTINAALNDKANFNFARDISPVATLTLTPYALVVNPSLPCTSVPELIAYARAHPGKLNVASGGIGSVSHLCCELFKLRTGIDVVHVPYRGSSPAHVDLMAGQVQAMFDALTTSIEHIKSGSFRVLAVTSKGRAEMMPNVPNMSEFVTEYEVAAWLGIGVSHDTPDEIVSLLNREINLGLAGSYIRSRLLELGGSVFVSSPAEFDSLIAQDCEKWNKVVTLGHLKPVE